MRSSDGDLTGVMVGDAVVSAYSPRTSEGALSPARGIKIGDSVVAMMVSTIQYAESYANQVKDVCYLFWLKAVG